MDIPIITGWRLIETSPGIAVVIGRVSRRPDRRDGAITVTSPVARLSSDVAITRSGSTYRLGDPLPADEALPPPYAEALLAKILRTGPADPDRLRAASVTVERCCRPEAAAGDALLARLRGGDA